jgi:hypothetical protein
MNALRAVLLALAAILSLPRASADGQELRVSGPEELVASSESVTCPRGEMHSFDQPAAAYRRDGGTVVLLAGNRRGYHFEGPSLDAVAEVRCGALLPRASHADPGKFRDNEWLFAIRSIGPGRAVGIVHNEYHGSEHGVSGCKVTSLRDFECWYGSVTQVRSADDARSFQRAEPPAGVVAALPYLFRPGMKRAGLFSPKVAEDPRTGEVYLLVTVADRNRRMRGQQCLLKARDDALSAWRAWDGSGFTLNIGSPYDSRSTAECAAVMEGDLTSVKYLAGKDFFVGVGHGAKGFWYAFSGDLIHWSGAQKFTSVPVPSAWNLGDPPPEAYPSLLDPDSSSRNFDRLDKRPYLYFVRFAVEDGKVELRKRRLLRVPVVIE